MLLAHRGTSFEFSPCVTADRFASAFSLGVSVHVGVGCARPARLSVSDSPPLNHFTESCILVVLVIVIPRCSLVCSPFLCFRFSISLGFLSGFFQVFPIRRFQRLSEEV